MKIVPTHIVVLREQYNAAAIQESWTGLVERIAEIGRELDDLEPWAFNSNHSQYLREELSEYRFVRDQRAADRHMVYVVAEWPSGPQKYRLSDPMEWGFAQDLWSIFADTLFDGEVLTAAYQPVRYFAVRSATDPEWPSNAPKVSIRYADDGRRVLGNRFLAIKALTGEA